MTHHRAHSSHHTADVLLVHSDSLYDYPARDFDLFYEAPFSPDCAVHLRSNEHPAGLVDLIHPSCGNHDGYYDQSHCRKEDHRQSLL